MNKTISIRDKSIKFKINLSAKVKKEANCFIACCPAINISSQGETKERALKNLKEKVNLFVATSHERGFFDKLIKEQRNRGQK